MIAVALAWILHNHTVGSPTLNKFFGMGAIVLTSSALVSSNSLEMRFIFFFLFSFCNLCSPVLDIGL